MKNVFSTRTVVAICSLTLAIATTSCNKFNNNDDQNNTPVAGLMAFNLAPGKSVELVLNNNSLTNFPLTYTSFTGSYLSVYPGLRDFTSYDYSTRDSLASTSFTALPNKYYSAFVVGNNNHYRNVIVEDNFDSLNAGNGQAYVRYINAIPDSTHPSVTIAANGSNVVNDPAGFASVSDFVAVTPGPISIAASNGSTINTSRTISVEAKKAYTILILGVPGSATLSDSVHIRFITNGTLADAVAPRASVSSARSSN